MTDFSLSLNEDQLQLKEWINGFAKDVMRPAAEEWDEREEFPWPVVQEAAKIGLYGMDFMAQGIADPTGLTMVVAIEELFWGDAGIGLSLMGSGLAAAAIAANGTPEQLFEWVPQCYGTADKVQLGALCASEPDAGSDVGGYRTRATYDEAKDEWTLNGTKAWITNGGIADVHVVVAVVEPGLGSRATRASSCRPAIGNRRGRSTRSRHPCVPHVEVVPEDEIPGSCLRHEGAPRRQDRNEGERVTGEKRRRCRGHCPTVSAMAVGIARAAYSTALYAGTVRPSASRSS